MLQNDHTNNRLLFYVCIFVQYPQIKSKCAKLPQNANIKKIFLQVAIQLVKNIVLNFRRAGRDERCQALVPYGRSVKSVIFTVECPQELIIAQLAESFVVYLLGALLTVSVPLSDLPIVQPVKIIFTNNFP